MRVKNFEELVDILKSDLKEMPVDVESYAWALINEKSLDGDVEIPAYHTILKTPIALRLLF
ncbi:hypothetical protein [Polynucleobacter sp.]|uniref:hypothetical protein n=1 Tax=Polynucleobacter sp. TaxID=2029855 RepID=UPI003F6A4EB1